MKAIILAGVLAGGIVIADGCKKGPAGPDPPRNPREYVWTVDTIDYPGSVQTLMRSIWGSSRTNIYICGHNDRGRSMYHWDGQQWSNVKLHPGDGGPLRGVGTLRSIFGFSAQNVYSVGDLFGNFFIHSDGSQWSEINTPAGEGLISIWGRSPEELWIGGEEGFLMRYDGKSFVPDSVPYTFDTTGMNIQVEHLTGNSATTHLVLSVAPDTLFNPIFYFYEQTVAQWEVTDSSYEFARIFVDPAGAVHRYGYNGVQRRMGNMWVTTLSGLTVGRNGMAASSENNMFVAGIAGPQPTSRLYHYDGASWFEYENLRMDDVTFTAVWTDGTEAFVVGIPPGFPAKSIVLRGK